MLSAVFLLTAKTHSRMIKVISLLSNIVTLPVIYSSCLDECPCSLDILTTYIFLAAIGAALDATILVSLYNALMSPSISSEELDIELNANLYVNYLNVNLLCGFFL